MLKVNKNITLNGTSEIDGQVVVYMSASISTDGNSNANINKSIANQDLYTANKEAVREDMASFEKEVYKVEDEMISNVKIQIDDQVLAEYSIDTIKTGKVGK